MATRFVFLLLPQLHILDLAGPDQALHEAMDYGADFSIEYCGINESIVSTSGLPFGEVQHFTKVKLKKGDFLVIPGSDFTYLISPKFLAKKDLFQWIGTNYTKGVNICSICIGAFVLAETGLLNGLSCTTHFKKTKELQKRYPKLKVIENILFTDHNGIYTSAGIASGIDLMLHIIEKLKGSYFAYKVARELVVYNRRAGHLAQESEMLKFRNHIHSGVHKVQDFIIENIHRKISMSDLANIANMSERNFTRVFKKETNITVNDFVTIIRKEKSMDLLKNPDLSKREIANKVGLQSEKQLARILNK
ncbi:MAG: DJ-1/PfpI family protein [Chitinophagales bacterium]|nr:DJ-1/PfpI family protein [Chitinophagales bacterium]